MSSWWRPIFSFNSGISNSYKPKPRTRPFNTVPMISLILASLITLSVLAAIFYYAGIEPARTLENWFSMFANGERLPNRPGVGFRYWLLPVHRELQGVEKRVRNAENETALLKEKLLHTAFLNNYILSSLIEAIVVVDEKREVILVNSEFMHLYQLTQSPMGRTLSDVAEDRRLDQFVDLAFRSLQVQGGRITKAIQGEAGRHPAFNVNAIPVCATEGKITAVVVLLLPLADRPRMVQVMKRHSERLEGLLREHGTPVPPDESEAWAAREEHALTSISGRRN